MMTVDPRTIALNGFRVHIRPEEFTAYTVELPGNSDLDQLQSEAGDAWSLWWNRGIVYGLPQGAGTELPGSAETKLAVSEHLGFVANVINTALPRVVPHYKAFRNRPFTFLGNKGEFVSEIRRKLPNAPAVLNGFTIRPRYALEAKVVDLGSEPFIGLFVTLSTRYEIPDQQPLTAGELQDRPHGSRTLTSPRSSSYDRPPARLRFHSRALIADSAQWRSRPTDGRAVPRKSQ